MVTVALCALRGCILFTVKHGIGSMSRFTDPLDSLVPLRLRTAGIQLGFYR